MFKMPGTMLGTQQVLHKPALPQGHTVRARSGRGALCLEQTPWLPPGLTTP